MKNVKIVVVGDDEVGKSCLLLTYMTKDFPGKSVITDFPDWHTSVWVENQRIKLDIFETDAGRNWKSSRLESYEGADVFLICFSLVEPKSLENVQSMWMTEIKEYCTNTPYFLVGTKSDLRDEFDQRADKYKRKGWEKVPKSKGEDMKEAIKAEAYFESSSKNQSNLNEVFETAIKLVLNRTPTEPAKVKSSDER
jgi:small GTP-binding protein